MDYNLHVGIDLHIHSTASDGTLSPGDILKTACAQNLGAISITDHDTIDGAREALRTGIPAPLHFLTGVELSAAPPPSLPRSGSFHILGYGIDLDDTALDNALNTLQEARKNRNPDIIARLNKIGFDLTLEQVSATVGDGQIGRPHIARVMRQLGYVGSIDDAFDRYLGHGRSAYVDKPRISCQRAVDIIRGAGGIAVLAHPFLLNLTDPVEMENLVVVLKDMGFEGIEVFYPEHPPHATSLYKELAQNYDMLMTGGTDFHGKLKPDIQMGSGAGHFFVPFALYERLSAGLIRNPSRS